MATWLIFSFQDANSPIIEELIFFHDFVMLILVYIISVVGIKLVKVNYNKLININLIEGQVLECIWTIIPALILIQIAIPSLLLLYILEESYKCSLTLKITGHQWYWRYEYSNFWNLNSIPLEFDSYLISNILNKNFRLLEVDNRIILPFKISTQFLVTAADVLHCWTIPSLGIKVDAIPGRLNQLKFISYHPGLLYGQCSEICGTNHSFIPIVIEFIKSKDFLNWIRFWE